MKRLAPIFFLLLYSPLAAQVILRGNIRDAESGDPLPWVHIWAGTEKTTSDSAGNFRLVIEGKADSLHLKCNGYQNIDLGLKAGKNRYLNLKMLPGGVELPTVKIVAGTERVLEDKKIHVHDYAFFGENLLLLIYNSTLKKSTLLVTTSSGEPLSSQLTTPEEPASLFTDCEGNVYAVGEEKVYKLHPGIEPIRMDVMSMEEYTKILLPCAGELEGSYFFRYRVDDQRMIYLLVTQEDPRPMPLTLVADSFALFQIADDSIMEEKGLGLKIADPQRRSFQNALNAAFAKHVLYAPVYAPLVVLQEKICILDHENGKALFFDAEGKALGKSCIYYHREKQWEKQIITDISTGKVYTVYNRNGYYSLAEIDLGSGTAHIVKEFEHPFVTRIYIRDGWVYYLYRDTQYDPVKRLYRLRLDSF